MTDTTESTAWLPETEALALDLLTKRVVLDDTTFLALIKDNLDRWTVADRALVNTVLADYPTKHEIMRMAGNPEWRPVVQRLKKILKADNWKVRSKAETRARAWVAEARRAVR